MYRTKLYIVCELKSYEKLLFWSQKYLAHSKFPKNFFKVQTFNLSFIIYFFSSYWEEIYVWMCVTFKFETRNNATFPNSPFTFFFAIFSLSRFRVVRSGWEETHTEEKWTFWKSWWKIYCFSEQCINNRRKMRSKSRIVIMKEGGSAHEEKSSSVNMRNVCSHFSHGISQSQTMDNKFKF